MPHTTLPRAPDSLALMDYADAMRIEQAFALGVSLSLGAFHPDTGIAQALFDFPRADHHDRTV